jgi:hypothetical protein
MEEVRYVKIENAHKEYGIKQPVYTDTEEKWNR